MDIKDLTETVQQNCHISDAAYAGNYTLCIFLLKMREYYRWEMGLPLTAPLKREDVREWLVARETQWEEIEDDELSPLQLDEVAIDPYDAARVNQRINTEGFVYSGGMGLFSKPHFFIGELKRHEQIEGVSIYVAGRELARDLVAPPSMYRDKTVIVREESLRRHLWERIDEWRFKKADPEKPLGRAIAAFDPTMLEDVGEDATEALLDRLSVNETEPLIQHELGEARAGLLLGPDWEVMLAAHPRSRLEFFARGGRDLLADCLTTLPTLLDAENAPSLHMYFANFSGVRRLLFPTLTDAYRRWTEGSGLDPMREAIKRGAEHWAHHLSDALAYFGTEAGNAEGVVSRIEAAAL